MLQCIIYHADLTKCISFLLGRCVIPLVINIVYRYVVYKLYTILCDFGCCDSNTLVDIHRTFVWKILTAWRISMQKIGK